MTITNNPSPKESHSQPIPYASSEVPNVGVYFAITDHPNIIRRLLIDLVDCSVLAAAFFLLIPLFRLLPIPSDATAIYFMFTYAAVLFLYLVILKQRSSTLGYWLFKVQIINLQGNVPSLPRLMLRLIFAFLGPANMFLDILWLTSDKHRQTVRDKLAQTYVINRGAKPIGQGHILYIRVELLGYVMLMPEVKR